MKLKLFLLGLIIFSFAVRLSAQTINCDECPGLPWQPAVPPYPTMQLLLTGGMVVITYQTRVCNGVYELKIISMSVSGLQQIYSLDEIYAKAFSEMIHSNLMGFPPLGNNLSNVWRIVQGQCWQYTNPEHSLMLPCNDECCITDIYVYMDCDHRYYDLINETGIPQCPEHGTYQGSECVYICNPIREVIKN